MDEVLAAVIQLYNRVVTFVYETSLLDIRVATARFTDERLASFFYTRSKLTHETLRRHTVAQFVKILSKIFFLFVTEEILHSITAVSDQGS